MRIFLISDNEDTLTGLRLAGITGRVAHSREDVRSTIGRILEDEDLAILAVTEKIAQLAPDEINEIKLNKKMPLIAVIPDRHGTTRDKDFITKYVREAIGINI